MVRSVGVPQAPRPAASVRRDGGGRQGRLARELPVQVRPAGAVTSGGKSGRGYSASLRRGRSARDKSPRHQQNGSGDDRRQVRPAGAAYVPAEVTTPAKTGRAPVSSPRHQHDAPDDRALQGLPVRPDGGGRQGCVRARAWRERTWAAGVRTGQVATRTSPHRNVEHIGPPSHHAGKSVTVKATGAAVSGTQSRSRT